MARASSTAALGECTTWSPGHLTSETRIPRRYLQPPSDQRELLDRPDAWLVRGFPNVPPSVLEDVRAQYVKESRAPSRAEGEALSSQPVSPASTKREEAFSSQPASPAQSATPHIDPSKPSVEDQESSEPGTPIPWSQSPSRHTRGLGQQREELETTASTTHRHSSAQHSSIAAGNNLSRARFLTDFPPSSSATSDQGLEIKIPQAVTEVLAPVNRQPVAALEPTPPSAQIIPCTITEKPSLAQAPQAPQAERRRRMKPVVIPSPEPVKHKHASRLTLPNTRADVLLRSSSPVVSSSPPPLPTVPHRPAETPSVTLPVGDQHIPAPENVPEVVAATSQLAANQGSSNSTDKPPPNGPSSQVPYTAFTVAYPGYRGSLRTFICGVLCILPLQKDRALPEFLYDDFVRVFSTDFLKYIDSLDEDAHPLSAIQFYNENVSRPLYTKGVLSKDSIKDVPNKYPDKSRAIQRALKKSDTEVRRQSTQQASDRMSAGEKMVQSPAVPTDTSHPLPQHSPLSPASVTNPESATREVSPPPGPIHSTMQMRPLQEHRVTSAPLAASPDTSGCSSVRQRRTPAEISASMANTSATGLEVLRTQVDSSPPNIQPSPTPPKVTTIKLPVASTFPSNVLSQISNPDSIPETVLKRRAAPRASVGSSTAESGGGFKRQKTATEDADKRALRFRKFLMQKRTQSSAPERLTPQ